MLARGWMGTPWHEVVQESVERIDRWPQWIESLATAGTFLVVVATGVVAYRALNDARETRHGQLITELMRDWTEPAAVAAHALHGRVTEKRIEELVTKAYGPSGGEATADELHELETLMRIANLIEALGVLVSEKAITTELVYKMWGGAVLTAWPKWDNPIRLLREYDNEPDTFEHFEKLAEAVQRISDERKRARRDASNGVASRAPREGEGAAPGTTADSSSSRSHRIAPFARSLAAGLAALYLISALREVFLRRRRSNVW
ncbi:MAG: DUF4760 domain-containing protein [Actinomycetota bacterium]|nr:DUF4760 domain-containing protein [Actinomycetota bacterium]